MRLPRFRQPSGARCEASQRSQRRCLQPVPQLKVKRQRRFEAVIPLGTRCGRMRSQFLEMQIGSLWPLTSFTALQVWSLSDQQRTNCAVGLDWLRSV
jgi:hypothetical protein